MEKQLNKKGKEIFDFLNSQVKEKGYPPSVREICAAVGLRSTSTVHGYLSKLEKLGLIQKDPSKPRALKIVKPKKGKGSFKRNKEPEEGWSGIVWK